MVEIKNISFGYGSNAVLKDFSLNIEKGSFTAILGANGSGKSTLLRLINGLLLPSCGSVLVGGLDTSDESKIYDLRSRAAIVFQNPDDQLVCAVVEDEAAFGAENIGVAADELRRRVDKALSITGLSEKAKHPSANLSGGEKQRLAIASALVMQPQLLLLDEPTSMLDPEGRRKVMDIIQSLRRDGLTVILVTHLMDEAAAADRCVVMDKGRILLDGTPSDVFFHSEELSALSLDIPEICRIADILRSNGIPVPQNVVNAEQMADFVENYILSHKNNCNTCI